MKKLFMFAFAALAMLSMVQADQLIVSTGSPSGSYSKFAKEINQKCAQVVPLVEQQTGGTVDNLNALVGNKANIGFAQEDILYFKAKTEDMSNVKVLVNLYPEELHFLTMSVSPIKVGGTLGLGAKSLALPTINQLAGQKVAAWGGSVVSAQIVRLQSEIAYSVVEVADFKAALAKLHAGEVAAIVMVGGAPMDSVAALDKRYRLLPIPEATMQKLKGVYGTSRLNYPKMGAAGIPTVSTNSMLVTRAYKTPKMMASLKSLRECVFNSLPEFKEEIGYHPKWNNVNPENRGRWPWYDVK